MKIHNPLDKLLNNEIKVKILRQLCKTNEESSGRQIAKEISVSPAACHKALQELHQQKVLNFKNIGKTHIYSLNEKNILITNLIKPIFQQESGLPGAIYEVIKEAFISKSEGITAAAVFGSVASKNEQSSSDIDLLIVVLNEKDKTRIDEIINELNNNILKTHGNIVSPYVLTEKEFRTKYANKLPVILNILNSHKLIYGKTLEKIAKYHDAKNN